MLRVPGSRDATCCGCKPQGADVRIVYSPLDAVKLAQANPDREVVFFAIGFETTAPANALAVTRAQALGVKNFSVLVSHVLVPPAITAILQSPGNRVQGFLGPGHVCTVMGTREYERHRRALPRPHRDHRLRAGRSPRRRAPDGAAARGGRGRGGEPVLRASSAARAIRGAAAASASVFEVCDRKWRGIGSIPEERLSAPLGAARATTPSGASRSEAMETREPAACISGQVLRGLKKPARLPGLRHGVHARAPRSAPPWCRPRAPAPRTTRTGGIARAVTTP